MKKVTLYNHKHIGTDDKPLISNIIFKILIEYLKKNEQDICNEILTEFTLELNQKKLYNYINHEYNKVQPKKLDEF